MNLWAMVSEGLGFGKAVAEAMDMPDDVDQARAIRHMSNELGRLYRKLTKAGLSPAARIIFETQAFGCRMALVRLGVPEGEIPKMPARPPGL